MPRCVSLRDGYMELLNWSRKLVLGVNAPELAGEFQSPGKSRVGVQAAGYHLMPKPLDPQHHDIADFDCCDGKRYGRSLAFQR